MSSRISAEDSNHAVLLATIERLRRSNVDLGTRLGHSEARCERLTREVARLREQLEELERER